ncbi:hypothetical protein PR202_ga12270 [Eleusine coracana subsp. coracana]|uniref:Uncharacterized protein n=1 Tax=Eleusine coracana subsp. coracana TaxID=191504 RepID=A0AAV5CBS5_ELECO|nr:hypothetical protein PR202_ga12270 [Eleusine coracana subsp. coracana]
MGIAHYFGQIIGSMGALLKILHRQCLLPLLHESARPGQLQRHWIMKAGYRISVVEVAFLGME